MATRHMLSDDIVLMQKCIVNNKEIEDKMCQSFYYLLHHRNGHSNMEGKNGEEYQKFMKECPEMKYIYLFDKGNVMCGRLVYSEGIAASELLMGLYGVEMKPFFEYYKGCRSLMRSVKIPLDMENEEQMSKEELKKLLYGDFLEYAKQHNLRIAGDLLGIKVGFSCEEGREWQYVRLNLPVEKSE